MGQAKLRGSKETRVKEGIEKRKLQEKIREEKRKIYFAGLSKEEKDKLLKQKLLLTTVVGLSSFL